MYSYMDELAVLILIAFAVRTLRNSIYYLFLWQNKEYRLDRLLLHLKTNEGKRLLFGPLSFIKALLFLTFIFTVFKQNAPLASAVVWLFSAFIVAEAIKNIREFSLGRLPLPEFTAKIVFVLALTLIIQLIFPMTTLPLLALDYLPFLDKMLLPLVSVQIGLFSIPARAKNWIFINMARNKIDKLQDLRVVGITGSYGKTSTKEFTAQLLSTKYDVVKTPSNNNTAIGVAKTIREKIKPGTEIFVVEAAAYRRGEIKQITDLIQDRLKLSVLTGLNAQHLPLFGSKKKQSEAKYEIIEALPRGAPTVINGDNERTRRVADKARKEGYSVYLYGNDRRFYASAARIKQYPQEISFNLKISENEAKVTAPLLGEHNVENILAAAAIGSRFGLDWRDIVAGIKILRPPQNTMTYSKINETIIIDDAYNANPDGAKAALNYLKQYRIPKILVLRPLIELGDESDYVHKQLGAAAAEVCDLIVLTNDNYYQYFVEGTKSIDATTQVVLAGGKQAFNLIEQKFSGEKVILFEGKDAANVLKYYQG